MVAVISNPVRYQSRYNLYRAWEKTILDAGARLTTVELAYGERPFELDCAAHDHPPLLRHVRVRTEHELWHKENLINLGISRLDRDWKYVAWIDADVLFSRPDWVQETLQQLQHYSVVQLFSQCLNLTPAWEPLGPARKGWIQAYLDGDDLSGRKYGFPHPGFAWAARRDAIDKLGRLIDTAILGSADLHMARALVGDVSVGLPHGISAGYRETLRLWQERADRHIRRNVGVVEGLVLHYWHGSRVNRRYHDRWKILVDTGYDPELDLKPDWQGIWQLTDRSPALRDGIRGYFRARHEDSIDL